MGMLTKNAHRQPPADTMAAPERRPGGDRQRADAAPQRHHLRATLGRVGADEQRDRRGHQERRARSLQHAARHQGGDVRRDAAQERAGEEHGERRAMNVAPPPDPVAGAAADHEQCAEHDRVRGDHPRQRRLTGVRVRRLEIRERDVHDRQVERRHERTERGHREHRRRPRPLGRSVIGDW